MNSPGTKRRILDVATRLFARHGFEGTSVSAIVDGAEVNKRMLYHYFGNKEALYRTVFVQQWTMFADWLEGRLGPLAEGEEGPQRARAMLLETIAAYFDYMAKRPRFVRLISWEGLEGGAISRSLWADVSGPLFQGVTSIIASAQKHGVLSPRLHIGHFVISMMGVVTYYFTFGRSLGDLIDGPVFTPEAISRRRAEVLRTVEELLLVS